MRKEVVRILKVTGLSKKEIESLVEVPKNLEMGDFAFPCFTLSKKLKKKPNEIAKDLAKKIKLSRPIEKIEAIGPYINFYFDKKKLASELINKISSEKDKFGSGIFGGKKIMIEFSQPNTHKAFHVGHIRGTSLGVSLSRIMEFNGDKVIRANYSGDTGMHIAKWIWCYKKYHSQEKIKDDESWFASIYVDASRRLQKNEKLQKEVEEINKKLDEGKDKALNKLWKDTRKLSIKSWDKIYSELNAEFDVHYFESEVEKRGKEIALSLEKKKIARISDEAVIIDLKHDGLGVWVLLRRDGTVLYSAKDLALAERKFKEYKLDRSLVVTDSAQDLHFRQLKKTLELMKAKYSKVYDHISYGAVRFPWGKMSSRTGENILYSDFKESLVKQAMKEIEKRFKLESTELYDRSFAISMAAIKYWMLKQDTNKTIIFNPKEALSFDGNTGPYLLYSYARAQSILEKANYRKQKKFEIKEMNKYEKKLVSELNKFPEIVQKAYRDLAPNLVANYSYSLAKTFSEFYHECQVIGSENEQFRLKLVDSFGQVMKNALYLLGIPVIREM